LQQRTTESLRRLDTELLNLAQLGSRRLRDVVVHSSIQLVLPDVRRPRRHVHGVRLRCRVCVLLPHLDRLVRLARDQATAGVGG
jgi:hypothetical protein